MENSNDISRRSRDWRIAWLGWVLLAFLGVGVLLLPAFMPIQALARGFDRAIGAQQTRNIAFIQNPTPVPAIGISDDQVNAIAKDMYCPVCESTPLDVCPTQACAEWRELIRQMLAEGKNEAEIKQYFVNRFGPQVLATPPAQGINLMVYIVPPVLILAGGLLLYGAFRSWRRSAPAAAPPADSAAFPTEDEYIRRLEEELRKQ
jgi:cytochrome c-type biogenesis protein CcmH